MTLTDAQAETFRRDGFLIVPGVVTGEELRLVREAADRVVDEAVDYGRQLDRVEPVALKDDHGFAEWHELDDRFFLYGRDDAGDRIFRRAERLFDRDPAFELVGANPTIRAIVDQLVGEPTIPGNDSLVVKMPAAGSAVPWHRDPRLHTAFDESGEAARDFTCDVYLDRSTVANGCVWGLPGTHRVDFTPPDDLDFGIEGAVPLEAEPGDLLLHCTGVLHGSPKNTTGDLRRTFYVHYRPPHVFTRHLWNRPPEWAVDRAERFARMTADRQAWEATVTA